MATFPVGKEIAQYEDSDWVSDYINSSWRPDPYPNLELMECLLFESPECKDMFTVQEYKEDKYITKGFKIFGINVSWRQRKTTTYRQS